MELQQDEYRHRFLMSPMAIRYQHLDSSSCSTTFPNQICHDQIKAVNRPPVQCFLPPSPMYASNKEHVWLEDDYNYHQYLQWAQDACAHYTPVDNARNTPSDFTSSPLSPLDSFEHYAANPTMSSSLSMPLSSSSDSSKPYSEYELDYDYPGSSGPPSGPGSRELEMELLELDADEYPINDIHPNSNSYSESPPDPAYSPYLPHSAYPAFSPLVSGLALQQHQHQEARQVHAVHHRTIPDQWHCGPPSLSVAIPPKTLDSQHTLRMRLNQILSSSQSSLPLLCLPLSTPNTIVPSQTQLFRPALPVSSQIHVEAAQISHQHPGLAPIPVPETNAEASQASEVAPEPQIEILAPRPTRPSKIAPNAIKTLLNAASTANADRKYMKELFQPGYPMEAYSSNVGLDGMGYYF
ncbi:hypothetical protein VKT23_018593 [Stygiomarasmius scandens]|uniref:Uncharacterized protein n=1 Tax=Marasmiellus scandens TaxID=2682957 RepID=A0ABR1INS4_9AGAR